MSLLLAAFVVAAFQIPPRATPADTTADAYLDPSARMLLAGARSTSDHANAAIEAYRLLSRRQISVGMRSARRNRLLYKREEAWRVSWRRAGEWRVEVLGSREVVPLAIEGPRVGSTDGDFGSLAPESIIGPSGGALFRIPAADDGDDGGIRHPLAVGSEAHYRFASGDTTRIRLADGGEVVLLELRVIPRRSHAELLDGSFWLESRGLAPVRGTFTLAAPARFSFGAGRDDGVVSALPFRGAEFQLDFLSIDYGLWEGRWWLPRLVALEGTGALGPFNFPLLVEQSFEEYKLYAAAEPWTPLPPVDTVSFQVASDPGAAEEPKEGAGTTVARQVQVVVLPRDSTLLLESAYLSESAYDGDARLADPGDLDRISGFLGLSRVRGVAAARPHLTIFPLDPRLLRYNRVEGLAMGSSVEVGLAPYAGTAALWLGLAERSPSILLEAESHPPGARRRHAVSVYRRLEPFSPADRPLSMASSLSAFLFGRDEGDYFRAFGGSLTLAREAGAIGSPEAVLEIYGERQGAVRKNTDVSVPHWAYGRSFRPNPVADDASQAGIAANVQLRRGLDPTGFRGTLEVAGRAETGSFRFAAPSARGYAGFPLPGRALGSVEGAAGTILGKAPVQSLWYVGGPGTVRGIRPENRLAGTAFWRGRAEIATQRPAARLILFGDAGWAGPRDDIELTAALLAAGVGLSAFDGILRADLARVIRGGSGWGVQLYLDAPL